MAGERLQVTVVLALPGQQTAVAVELEAGASARDAVEKSGLLPSPGVDAERCAYGIFGREVPAEQRLRPGDRVEILRPLQHDPRARRRELARQGRTMGRKT